MSQMSLYIELDRHSWIATIVVMYQLIALMIWFGLSVCLCVSLLKPAQPFLKVSFCSQQYVGPIVFGFGLIEKDVR